MLQNLEWVTRYSSRGYPFRVLESQDVLPIIQELLNVVFYIYRTKEDAESGALSGGSGFMVGVPLEENKAWTQLYAVTARHVLDDRKMRDPVIRLNLIAGGFDCLPTNKSRWVMHPDGDDLAVLPIDLPEDGSYKVNTVFPEDFASKERLSLLYPGDEVFMVGRFFSHEGKQQNNPTVRFGNISMLPSEPMLNKYGHEQETFLVEQRSLPGYSGSPVFVLIDHTKPRPPMWLNPATPIYKSQFHGPWLLGIDWVHIHDYEPVLKSRVKTERVKQYCVKAHSGMAGVIPASRLTDMLNSGELAMQRKKDDERITREKKETSYISYDSAESGEETFTQSDFESALKKASRRVPSSRSDSEKK